MQTPKKEIIKKSEKMGPIVLDIEISNFYEAWEESFISEV